MSEIKEFDIVVVGAGPGGYVAAIKASQLGLKTALIEKEKLGGTCMNIGCIPSKALLDSSKIYEQTQKKLPNHGISVENIKLDISAMIARKDKIVESFAKGISTLLKGNNVTLYKGSGSLTAKNEVNVTNEDGSENTLKAKNIILATGSVSRELPFLPYDKKTIISSTEALALTEVPENLLVIGAGAIGLELGLVWSRLGSNVTIIEVLPDIIPGGDTQISKTLERALKKQKIKFSLGTKIESHEKTEHGIKLSGTNSKGKEITFEGNKVLVATGRKPYHDSLGLESVGITPDPKTGLITVDENFKTSADNIYAIGDIIAGPMLAHKAEEEAISVTEFIATSKKPHINFNIIPGVVYTTPEVASVGKTEEELINSNIEFETGIFNFRANGRAVCMESLDGMVKIISDKKTKKCLGAHIVGPNASDLIAECVLLLNQEGSADTLAHSIHAHPTLSEAVKEAAQDVSNSAIHALPRKK
jgi:dihydrolipoamide dehydrogenase